MVLGQWYIESTLAIFDAVQVNERANTHVERQLPDGPTGRQRFTFTCPDCGQKPVLRQDTIDDKLAAEYEQNAQQKIVYLPV